MECKVSSSVLKILQDEAAKAAPEEACGLLLGEAAFAITSAIPARNVHAAPQTHFEIDPQALINAHREARSGGLKVLGYYHSHPVSAPEPSATDSAMASGDGRIWAIIGRVENRLKTRLWLDTKDGFLPLPLIHV